MSWDSYLTELQKVGVEIGGLFGQNGALWASHPDFQFSPNEIVILKDVISTNNESVYSTGINIGGKRWTVILIDTDFSVMVLKGKDTDNQKTNLVVALSNMAVVCGANKNENVTAGVIRTGVEQVRDYLKSVNY